MRTTAITYTTSLIFREWSAHLQQLVGQCADAKPGLRFHLSPRHLQDVPWRIPSAMRSKARTTWLVEAKHYSVPQQDLRLLHALGEPWNYGGDSRIPNAIRFCARAAARGGVGGTRLRIQMTSSRLRDFGGNGAPRAALWLPGTYAVHVLWQRNAHDYRKADSGALDSLRLLPKSAAREVLRCRFVQANPQAHHSIAAFALFFPKPVTGGYRKSSWQLGSCLLDQKRYCGRDCGS